MRTRAPQEAPATRGRGVLLILAGALAAALLGGPVAGAHAATVTKLADTDGECTPDDCSLREAINGGDGVIDFAPGLTGQIAIQSALPRLSHDVEIRGPGAEILTVRRNPAAPPRTADWNFRIFAVSGGVSAEISGLTIENGLPVSNCDPFWEVCPPDPDFGLGGGIDNTGTLTVRDSVVRRNDALGDRHGAGGGIYNTGTMALINSTVSENGAYIGAAIFNRGTMALINSTVSRNRGQEEDPSSGSVIMHRDPGHALTIVNSTVSGNRYSESMIQSLGPGVGPVTIRNSTIANNRFLPEFEGASGGQLLVSDGTATLRSTIIAGVRRDEKNCSADEPRGTLISRGYNLADDRSCNLTRRTDQPNTDPRLRPLGDYGGPTPTMPLLPASPAIDKGISDELEIDQRGGPRPVDFPWVPNAPGGDGADIGAFERQALAPFRFGKVRHNTRRGIARLAIRLTGPGRVILQRRPGVRRFVQVHRGEGAGRVVLRVRPRGKARQRLNRQARRTGQGRVRVRAQVTFRPWAGEPLTKGRQVRLVRDGRR